LTTKGRNEEIRDDRIGEKDRERVTRIEEKGSTLRIRRTTNENRNQKNDKHTKREQYKKLNK